MVFGAQDLKERLVDCDVERQNAWRGASWTSWTRKSTLIQCNLLIHITDKIDPPVSPLQ